jgi:hypothetical protein
VADNQSQWPAQYPRYSPPAGYPVQPPAGYHPAPPPGYPFGSAYHPQQARNHAAMRASSADRERAVDVLKAGFAEGRLTQDEYNDRMGQAYAARTYGELAALTADLPAGVLPAWPVPVYQAPPATNSMAIASMVLGLAEFFTVGLTALPAVICGHMARRQIKQTAERGDGLATSGLVLGYMAIIIWSIVIVGTMAFAITHGGGGPASSVPGGQ